MKTLAVITLTIGIIFCQQAEPRDPVFLRSTEADGLDLDNVNFDNLLR